MCVNAPTPVCKSSGQEAGFERQTAGTLESQRKGSVGMKMPSAQKINAVGGSLGNGEV